MKQFDEQREKLAIFRRRRDAIAAMVNEDRCRLRVVAADFGVSRERVRSIAATARRKAFFGHDPVPQIEVVLRERFPELYKWTP